jgi:hypothetical protein
MLSSFAAALTICFFAGTVVVLTLAARARADDSVARLLYDTEHPPKTR